MTITPHKVVVRDNVLFELGLFIGSIGLERALILQPRGVDLHIPSDLIGLNREDYEPNRSDGSLKAAVTKACTNIKEHADKVGLLNSKTPVKHQTKQPRTHNYTIREMDLLVMTECLETVTQDPRGKSFHAIHKKFRNVREGDLSRSLIKLVRMKFLERTLEEDTQDDYVYYGYKVTETGIDYVLNNEGRAPSIDEGGDDLKIDDIPF